MKQQRRPIPLTWLMGGGALFSIALVVALAAWLNARLEATNEAIKSTTMQTVSTSESSVQRLAGGISPALDALHQVEMGAARVELLLRLAILDPQQSSRPAVGAARTLRSAVRGFAIMAAKARVDAPAMASLGQMSKLIVDIAEEAVLKSSPVDMRTLLDEALDVAVELNTTVQGAGAALRTARGATASAAISAAAEARRDVGEAAGRASLIREGMRISIFVVMAIAMAVLALVYRATVKRLQTVSAYSTRLANGDYAVDSPPADDRDPLGRVARDVAGMGQALAKAVADARQEARRAADQAWMNEGLRYLADATRDHANVGELGDRALDAMAKHLGLVVGRFYHVQADGLHCVGRYADGAPADDDAVLMPGCGLPGEIAAGREARIVTGVAQSNLKVASGLLSGAPDCVYLVPVVFRDEVKAVFELGLTAEPEDRVAAFVEAACIQLGITLFATEQRLKTEQALTELEEKSRQLEGAVQARSEFLANMSHEIRTPINGVLGMNEVLLKTGLDEKQKRCVLTVRRSAEALLRVINDILDFSKIDAGKLTLQNASFDLRNLIEDVGDLFAESAQQKGVELVCAMPVDAHTAYVGDAGRLRQILTNLVGNAIKFTEAGEVVVSVTDVKALSDGAVELKFGVRDTGMGISEEGQQHVFDSFTQVDSGTSRSFGGTGLGLAISSQLVKLMGGDIGLVSAPGRGSTFWFTVRLKPEAYGMSARRLENERALESVRVLAVDDNETNRELYSRQFEAWGVDCATAVSGPEALTRLRSAARQGMPFDLVVLDMHMPGMDGMELARHMQDDPLIAATPRVMLSSVVDEFTQADYAAVGIESFLAKPVRQAELFHCLIGTLKPALLEPPAPVVPEDLRSELRFDKRVLLVEDNLTNQEVALALLEPLALTVDCEPDGQRAVYAWARGEYDLVLMDCQMPVLDGFAATAQIRERERAEQAPRTPIVALTANALEGDRERCLSAGMDDYLSKPFSERGLVDMLLRWLEPEALPEESGAQQAEPGPVQMDAPPAAGETAFAVPGTQASVRGHDVALASESAPESAPGTSGPDSVVIDDSVLERYRARERKGRKNVLSRIVGAYLEQSTEYLAQMRDALTAGDAETIKRCAHTLKASSANVGATALSALCAQIEHDAGDGNLAAVAACMDEVQNAYAEAARLLGHELRKAVA